MFIDIEAVAAAIADCTMLDEVAQRLRLVRRRTAIARTALFIAVVGLIGYGIARWQPSFAQPVLVASVLVCFGIVFRALSRPRCTR